MRQRERERGPQWSGHQDHKHIPENSALGRRIPHLKATNFTPKIASSPPKLVPRDEKHTKMAPLASADHAGAHSSIKWSKIYSQAMEISQKSKRRRGYSRLGTGREDADWGGTKEERRPLLGTKTAVFILPRITTPTFFSLSSPSPPSLNPLLPPPFLFLKILILFRG